MTLLATVFERLETLGAPAFVEFILVGVKPKVPRMFAPQAIYISGSFEYGPARRLFPESGASGAQPSTSARIQGDFEQQFSTASFARPTTSNPNARQNFDVAQEQPVKMELLQNPATLTIHYLATADAEIALTELLTSGSDGVLTGVGNGIFYTLTFGNVLPQI